MLISLSLSTHNSKNITARFFLRINIHTHREQEQQQHVTLSHARDKKERERELKREFRVQKYAYPSVIIVLAIVNLIPVSGVELFLWWLLGGRRILLLLLLRHHHYSLFSQIKEG